MWGKEKFTHLLALGLVGRRREAGSVCVKGEGSEEEPKVSPKS